MDITQSGASSISLPQRKLIFQIVPFKEVIYPMDFFRTLLTTALNYQVSMDQSLKIARIPYLALPSQ